MTTKRTYPKATAKKLKKQDAFLEWYAKTGHAKQSCEYAKIPGGTYRLWVAEDTAFNVRYDAVKEKYAAHKAANPDLSGKNVLNLERDMPPKGSFADWRRRYIGRSVPPHQEPIFKAIEDRTNQRVFIFGPPGSGKDTGGGDTVLYFGCDDRSLRSAWIMKGEKFSRRRLSERLAPYLTDPKIYNNVPLGADSIKPIGSLIEDYGPFMWDKDMVYPDGTQPARPTWTKNEMYFVGSTTAEAEPNLWATGVSGQLYGARVDLMVVSDPWDRENAIGSAVEVDLDWFKGTMRTRLDDRGRLIVLGTRLFRNDPYERLLAYLIGDARVVEVDGYYTKYSNGVATVIYPAIQFNEDGEEESYWPEKFPLHSAIELPDGTQHRVDQLTNAEIKEYAASDGVYIQGLLQVREDDPDMFETMYQQNPPTNVHGEFSDVVLNHCDDINRTLKKRRAGTTLVLGVDPARTYGAAWVLWEWDPKERTCSLVDFFYGEKLGTQGIKDKLLLAPIEQYMPRYLVYEVNRESAVLEMPEIQKAIRDSAVQLVRHSTQHGNRGKSLAVEGSAQVSSMVFDMRDGTIRFPAASKEDRTRMDLVKKHFHNWDEKQQMRETKRGSWHHITDDIAMAAWVGWTQIVALKEKSPVKSGVRNIPEAARRAWQGHQPKRQEESPVRARNTDLVAMFYGGHDG
jgi:hypothetical protein